MSMIGHKMLSWLDNRLRAGTGKQDIPFGGVSVILMGDFGQLPPVGDKPMYVSDQVMRQAGQAFWLWCQCGHAGRSWWIGRCSVFIHKSRKNMGPPNLPIAVLMHVLNYLSRQQVPLRLSYIAVQVLLFQPNLSSEGTPFVLEHSQGTNHRSQYRKKRKGNAFAGVQKHAKKVRKTSLKESEITQSTPSSACGQSSSSSKCDEPISASRLKMRPQNSSDCPSNSLDDGETVQSEGYRLVDLKKLSSTLSEAHVCEEGHLNLKENSSMRSGLMSDLSAECSSCSEATSLKTSSSVTNQGQSFDVNRRAVYHSLETGGGYEGLVSFCSIMNMPCISSAAYYKLVDTILVAQEAEAKDEMQQASQRLRDYIFQENGEKNCDDVVVDVAVSFDGTWAKRGFTSLTGVVFVLAVDTGEVLDYHVLSKECRNVQ
ncbi:Hypothetical predicted protein [Paramuricea clavata]|uniref:ATP-dependent DNA helicase n=1 Tax=Paramuricea clavata TaxID=317549 RepID=A0A6S7JIN2_PARCT|nr:Hypothetical predicted protein [Paramuricea clavata]